MPPRFLTGIKSIDVSTQSRQVQERCLDLGLKPIVLSADRLGISCVISDKGKHRSGLVVVQAVNENERIVGNADRVCFA